MTYFFRLEKKLYNYNINFDIIKIKFIPVFEKWLKLFFENMEANLNNIKNVESESMINSYYGLKNTSNDFLTILFHFGNIIKPMVDDKILKQINVNFENKFVKFINNFLENSKFVSYDILEFDIFFKFKRKDLERVCEKKIIGLENKVNLLPNIFSAINNFDHIRNNLKKDDFYKKILFNFKRNNFFENWIENQISVLSDLIYLTNFSFIKTDLYDPTKIKKDQFLENSESKKIINELKNTMNIIKDQLTEDYSITIKKYLYKYILNDYILRISFLSHKYKNKIGKNLFNAFKNDFEIVNNYFLMVQNKEVNYDNTEIFDKFYKFFLCQQKLKDSEDELVHFIYKLKNKRFSVFGIF